MRGGVVMTDEVTGGSESGGSAGFSRRNALKAGVAAGVGVAAWSGASITSLGGTPAYAVACSQSIFIDLSEGCRNVDSESACAFGYHPLKTVSAPFTLTNNFLEGTCCNAITPVPRLTWDHTALPNLECVVHVRFYQNGENNCVNDSPPRTVDEEYVGTPSTSSTNGFVDIPLSCYTFTDKGQGTNYTIFANCATPGAPDDCFG